MKIKWICLFVWILCFSFSRSYADQTFDPNQYRLFIESSHTFLYNKDQLVTQLRLSNQTEWYLSSDSILTEDNFKPGTEIYLAPALMINSDQQFWMHRENETISTTTWLVGASKKFLPQLTTKYKKLNKPAGWFSEAEYDYIFELSDGSKWLLDKEGEDIQEDLLRWEQGQSLIVSSLKETDYNEWYLMNGDKLEVISVNQKLQDLGCQESTYIPLTFSVTPYLGNDSDLIKID